jgi:hypothetical protein
MLAHPSSDGYLIPCSSSLPTRNSIMVTEKITFADQFNDNVNKSIGFTLSIPIFNGLQTVHRC